MTDIALCQTKTVPFLRKTSYFFGWLVIRAIFACAKRQVLSSTMTIQCRQLTNKGNSILTYLAAAASFQRLQALQLRIHSSFATQGFVPC
jgi:hypothetical protein